jgi:transcriptional regulator with PAS, ATPase and Fis domain
LQVVNIFRKIFKNDLTSYKKRDILVVTSEVTTKKGGIKMLDRNALKAEFVKKGLNQKDVAELLGISEKTFISRMKKGAFGTDEAELMIRHLDIKDPAAIFFATQVT